MTAPAPVAPEPKQLGHRHHLRVALRSAWFRRLFSVRLAAQFGDGVFQLSLAGAVLFNPERQANAADVAAGFALLLLPYSVVGPFAGVLLDRWSRQRVLVWTSVTRAAVVLAVGAEIGANVRGLPFYATALVVISTSRFFLAALSASLPHVVGADELVTANSLSTTVGGLAATAGGAAAVGVRAALGGASSAHYAVIAAAAAVPYLFAAVRASGLARDDLGPDDARRRARESLADVACGLASGVGHLNRRRPALYALAAVGVHRLCYGLFAVCTVLLYRNSFTADGPLQAGLSGLAQVVVAVAIGAGLGALVTPPVTRRLGFTRWCAAVLTAGGLVQLGLVLPYRLPLYLAAAWLLGFCAQSLKICVDTLVQRHVDDDFRGRVFALYDVVFNASIVTAAALTALVLPADGRSPVSVIVLGLAYLVTALTYSRAAGRANKVTPAAASTSG